MRKDINDRRQPSVAFPVHLTTFVITNQEIVLVRDMDTCLLPDVNGIEVVDQMAHQTRLEGLQIQF
jgi:hypothetical protein